MSQYKIFNGANPTTAAFVPMTTTTSIKTLLQVKPGATQVLRVLEWGISFDGITIATPGKVELIVTDVAATSLTAHVAAGINKFDAAALLAGNPTTDIIEVGTSSTGYHSGSSAEGSITATRLGDVQLVSPTNQTAFQWSLGQQFTISPAEFCRIRVHFGTAINAVCYMLVEA